MANLSKQQNLATAAKTEDVRTKKIANDSAELAHKRESSAAGTKHFNERRQDETKRLKAGSEQEQHKAAGAKADLEHHKVVLAHAAAHEPARAQAETDKSRAEAELAQHKVAHARTMAGHEHEQNTIKTASAQSSLVHQRAMNAHDRSRARGDTHWEDEKRQRQRVEWQQHDEDRAHRLVHQAQLNHAILHHHRQQAWAAVAHGLTGSGGSLGGAMRKQVGGH